EWYRQELPVGDREPDEVAEVDGEGQFCDRQRRFQRPIFATPPRLRFSLDPVLRCPRKIRFVIEDRFQDRARVVEGKTDAERKQGRGARSGARVSCRSEWSLWSSDAVGT